ncbi:MAG: phosphoglucosamine mutase [candidate division WOR-3 bacterium]
MGNLFFTISGLRGIIGESLTPELVARISAHFGNFSGKGEIIIGEDTRKSSEMIKSAAISGLLGVGITPVDIGVVPTPTILFAVREKKAKGGIAVTGSHNPPEWNALKFIGENGTFLKEKEIKILKNLLKKKPKYKKSEEIKKVEKEYYIEKHINAILNEKIFNIKKIKEKRFNVGIDGANGAASLAIPLLCEKLNCKVFKINCDKPGYFEREPEPTANNLDSLRNLVLERNLDIGFATDADGDRLVIILKGGKILSEEHTLPLFIYYMLSKIKEKKPVITNYSTSRMVDEVAKKFGASVKRTKVGEAFVVEKMEKEKAILGGEGNGGVIYRNINFTRDSLIGVAAILSLLCEVEDSRDFEKLVPEFFMKKIKIPYKRINFDKFIKILKPKEINMEDGLLLNFDDGFLHIRKSNTEPIIRVIGEFKENKKTEEIFKKIKNFLK